MNQQEESNKIEDLFMKSFKYYKCNKPKPSLDKVISIEVGNDKISRVYPDHTKEDPRSEALGLRKLSEWDLFSFTDHPGLFFIKNPFTPLGQRYWIRKCLEEYPKKPNKLNIDVDVESKDWWSECYEGGKCNWQLQKKLRWTTLGYHHNWDTKIYSEEHKNAFPQDLAELSDVVALYLGHEKFKAEAAIVNYYHMNSTLSAHTDHSEVNLDAPLFSFSFGQSCIFLLGGKHKSIEPSPILLSSGDIIVMSKQARLCYHAVPKILPAKTTPWNEEMLTIENTPDFKYITNKELLKQEININADDVEWRKFQNYIAEARINMNVRQVLNERQKSLTDVNFNQ